MIRGPIFLGRFLLMVFGDGIGVMFERGETPTSCGEFSMTLEEGRGARHLLYVVNPKLYT